MLRALCAVVLLLGGFGTLLPVAFSHSDLPDGALTTPCGGSDERLECAQTKVVTVTADIASSPALQPDVPAQGAASGVPDERACETTRRQVRYLEIKGLVALELFPQLAQFSGSADALLATPLGAGLRNHSLQPSWITGAYRSASATCLPVVAVLPVKAELVGTLVLVVVDGDSGMETLCAPSRTCKGEGWLLDAPIELKNRSVRYYYTVLTSVRPTHTLRVRMTVAFK